jgi:hypothetical protein
MKRMVAMITFLFSSLTLLACGVMGNTLPQTGFKVQRVVQEQENIIYLTINEHFLSVTLTDNSSVSAFMELLAIEDITMDMRDYGGFEKVGEMETRLPQNDKKLTSEPGDLMLYQGNSLVIFYAPNTWNYTRLGKINDITQDELINILGGEDVTVTWSLQ